MSRRAIRTATTGSLPLVAAIAAFLLVTGAHAQTVNFQVVVNAQNPLVVGEGGTVGYSLRTRGVPTHDVTVGIGGHTGTDVSLSDTSLLIVTDNSDVFFTVIVTAAEDDDAVDDLVVLTHTVNHWRVGDYGAQRDGRHQRQRYRRGDDLREGADRRRGRLHGRRLHGRPR